MRVLNQFSALAPYGINALTSEACPFGLRILCDLSEEGRSLVARFLGTPDMDCFPENWNSYTSDGTPAVSSVLLPRSAMRDLMVFVLFVEDECSEVILCADGTVVGIGKGDDYRARYLELAQSDSRYTVLTLPHGGDRNTHLFSGRIV